MRCELLLDQTCTRLPLPAGAVLRSQAGTLWLTWERRGREGASPDIVLEPGQQHRVEQAADYLLTGLTPGETVRCTLELPAARARLRWVLSWR